MNSDGVQTAGPLERLVRCRRVRAGEYEYKGYRIRYCGYHAPDQARVWEATDSTNCGCFHAHRLRDVRALIDDFEAAPTT